MRIGKEFCIINKCLAFTFVFAFAALSSFAAENSLSGVDIKQSNGSGYQVFLKLDKKAQVKKIVESEDNLTLVVSSTLPSESMEIIYDSEDNFSNVIVQKKNSDNTLISIQGKNIADAEIYTKELSTGVTKQLDTNDSLLNGFFFIADKKILGSSLLGMFFFLLMMLVSRPKNKRYSSNEVNKIVKSKQLYANTLRNKNLLQSKNIPSINYKVSGSFNSVNSHVSAPKDFVINNNNRVLENEQIRKAG